MKRIPLSRGKWALVDDNLFVMLFRYSWSLDGCGYPQTNRKTAKGWRVVRMHRVILGLVDGEMADHINGNKLDNRIANLRKCVAKENIRNRPINKNNKTGVKGVHFNKVRGVYQAYITVDWKHKYLGAFNNPEGAAAAYNAAATEHFGEFAWLNIIE